MSGYKMVGDEYDDLSADDYDLDLVSAPKAPLKSAPLKQAKLAKFKVIKPEKPMRKTAKKPVNPFARQSPWTKPERKGARPVQAGVRVREQINWYNSDPTDVVVTPKHVEKLVRRMILEEQRFTNYRQHDNIQLKREALNELQYELEQYLWKVLVACRTLAGFKGQQTVQRDAFLAAKAISVGAQVVTRKKADGRIAMNPLGNDSRVIDPEAKCEEMTAAVVAKEGKRSQRNDTKLYNKVALATKFDKYSGKGDLVIYEDEDDEDAHLTFGEMPYPINADVAKLAYKANITRIGSSVYDCARAEAKCWLACHVRAAFAALCSGKKKTLTRSIIQHAVRTCREQGKL